MSENWFGNNTPEEEKTENSPVENAGEETLNSDFADTSSDSSNPENKEQATDAPSGGDSIDSSNGGEYRFGVNAPSPVPNSDSAHASVSSSQQETPSPYITGTNTFNQGAPTQQDNPSPSVQAPAGQGEAEQAQYGSPNVQGGFARGVSPQGARPQSPYGTGVYGQQNQPDPPQTPPSGYGAPYQNGGYQPINQNPQQQNQGYGAPGGYPYNQYGQQYNGQQYGQYPYQKQPPTYKKKGPKGIFIALSILCVVALIVGAAILVYNDVMNDPPVPSSSSNSSSSDSSNAVNSDAPAIDIVDNPDDTTGLSTSKVVEKNLDSTVIINLYEPSFDNLLGENTEKMVGSGSGIVWTKDGYIITNAHVVFNENAKKNYERIEVVFYDGTKISNAKVIGADTSTDLALLQVDRKDLNAAEFGDTSALKLGDRLIALGNAGGLSWTVTQGILSGKDREIYSDNYSIKCIQTDAAINPGNSGGPLLNVHGQVIAINSAKFNNADNLGFAIPMDEAKKVIDDLAKYGYPRGRVRLGITGTADNGIGFRIATIADDSCLKDTAARVGDIIISIDGVNVPDHATLSSELRKHAVGDKVTIGLLKTDGSRKQLSVTVTLPEAKG